MHTQRRLVFLFCSLQLIKYGFLVRMFRACSEVLQLQTSLIPSLKRARTPCSVKLKSKKLSWAVVHFSEARHSQLHVLVNLEFRLFTVVMPPPRKTFRSSPPWIPHAPARHISPLPRPSSRTPTAAVTAATPSCPRRRPDPRL